MGLLGKLLGGLKMKDPVDGSAEIVAASPYEGRGIREICVLQLVVEAEGIEPTAVETRGPSTAIAGPRWE